MKTIIFILIIALFGNFAVHAQTNPKGANPESTTSAAKAQTYKGVVVGVSKYDYMNCLQYSDDDAREFYQVMTQLYGADPKNFVLLTDTAVTVQVILDEAQRIIKTVEPGDVFVLYFSGHGGTDTDGDGFLLLPGAETDDDFFLSGTGFGLVHFAKIASLIAKRGGTSVLITDACRSGALNSGSSSLALLKSSGFNFKFMSCKAEQTSTETEALANGIYTYHLLNALCDSAYTDDSNELTTNDLSQFLLKKVKKTSKQKQIPVFEGDTEFVLFSLSDRNKGRMLAQVYGVPSGNGNSLVVKSGNTQTAREFSDPRTALIIGYRHLFDRAVEHKRFLPSDTLAFSTVCDTCNYGFYSAAGVYVAAQTFMGWYAPDSLDNMKFELYQALTDAARTAAMPILDGYELKPSPKHLRTAMQRADFAARLYPKDTPLYLDARILYLFLASHLELYSAEQTDVTKGIALCDSILLLNPNAAFSLNTQGQLYTKVKNYAEAERVLQKCIKVKPAWTEPHMSLGRNNTAKGDVAKALKNYDKVIAMQPDKSKGYTAKAEVYVAQKNYAEAENYFEAALKRDSTNAYTYTRYAEAELARGNAPKAAKLLKRAVNYAPDDYTAPKQTLAGMPKTDNEPKPDSSITASEFKEPEMVFIKGGTFTMGSPASEVGRDNDETQHSVTVSDFYMGKYEVTFDEYDKFCEATGRIKPDYSGFGRESRPLFEVSWYDAVEYCNWLSLKAGLTPYYTIDKSEKDPANTSKIDELKWLVSLNGSANGYRLSTEAEWEYACRTGTTTPFNTGNNLTTSQANYDGNYPYNGNAEGEFRQKTTPVGSFAPNAWGLYDMHGNVWEWCSDWYGTYPAGSQTNPQGATTGSDRVIRGGNWRNYAKLCRTADRSSLSPGTRGYAIGFRLSRNK